MGAHRHLGGTALANGTFRETLADAAGAQVGAARARPAGVPLRPAGGAVSRGGGMSWRCSAQGAHRGGGSAGWETRLGWAGREWWRRGLRVGVRAALKDLRADQAERRFEKVEAGECAGFKERWRTKAV
eukprot:2270572-Prymnesium_polylepis.1